jgi:RNA polymerase sigma factor (sigma-70 family)
MAVAANLDPVTGARPNDVGELYRTLSGRLEQIVRFDVRAPDAVIEEACQFAWTRFVDHADRVRHEAVLSWLVTTAVREAFKLIRRGNRFVSLDAVVERGGETVAAAAAPGPDELIEQRERLRALAQLSERQQRLVWLHALGLSYNEIALYTGCTPRTVERQLLRAKRRLRAGADD